MTTQGCHSDEELGVLAGLPDADARLAHVAQCPRCSALLAEYRGFMSGETAPGARLAEADGRLAQALAAGMDAAAYGARTPVQRPDGWFARLFAPALRPALGLAAFVVLAGGVWFSLQ